jgi:hypothetical protein
VLCKQKEIIADRKKVTYPLQNTVKQALHVPVEEPDPERIMAYAYEQYNCKIKLQQQRVPETASYEKEEESENMADNAKTEDHTRRHQYYVDICSECDSTYRMFLSMIEKGNEIQNITTELNDFSELLETFIKTAKSTFFPFRGP